MASLIKRTYRKTLEPRVERLTLLYVVIFTIGFVVGLWQALWMACVRLTWGSIIEAAESNDLLSL